MAAPAPQPPKFVQELEILVRARYPLIWLVSWEEQRLDSILQDLAARHGKSLWSWSVTRGLRKMSGGRAAGPADNTREPPAALAAIEKLNEPALVVLKDFHPYLTDPVVVRAVRELAHFLKSTPMTLLILSSTLAIPPELEKEVTVLDIPLPTFRDLTQLLREIIEVVRQGNKATIDLRKDQAEQLIKAAMGLTLSEAENAFAKAIATDDRLDATDVQLVLEEKRQVIRKSGLLEYYTTADSFSNIGGLAVLKDWLNKRTVAFTDEARAFGLPAPKGILLLGVQGCGKSLCAKAVSRLWQLPLLRFDMGRMFGSLVGSSEENVRRAIAVAESVAPAVLWVDEIDKAFVGSQSSGATDGGTTARVFGTFLTWLSEKNAPVFVVTTANDVSQLPPELLRKGRLDEIFYVDLPSDEERGEIFQIHLAKRHRDPKKFDLPALVEASRDFSGAEIEEAIISALYDAFYEKRELTTSHVLTSLRQTVPLAKTMSEKVTSQRKWAAGRTRNASTSQWVKVEEKE